MATDLDLELDPESGCYEIALFEVVEGENGPGVTLETRMDQEVVTEACQEIVDIAGRRLSTLIGLQIHVQARPLEMDNASLAFFASLGYPEDAELDLALASKVVQAAMKVLIEGLLPGAEIKSVHTHDRSLMN